LNVLIYEICNTVGLNRQTSASRRKPSALKHLLFILKTWLPYCLVEENTANKLDSKGFESASIKEDWQTKLIWPLFVGVRQNMLGCRAGCCGIQMSRC